MTGEQVVRGLLRPRGGDEDRPLVAAQHVEPGGEVARVVQLAVDPAVGAQERRAHFGDQLLGRVGVIAEALPELPVAAGTGATVQWVSSCSAVA